MFDFQELIHPVDVSCFLRHLACKIISYRVKSGFRKFGKSRNTSAQSEIRAKRAARAAHAEESGVPVAVLGKMLF